MSAADAGGSGAPETDLSVIVPVFDERESVEELHASIVRALDGRRFEVLFVDDGSRDGSAEVLDALAAKDPRVRVLHFRRNYGQTAAIAAGIDHARSDVLVPIDADLQNDPADIPALVAKLGEGWDVVSGWRRGRKDAASRVLPSVVANRLISMIAGVRLHDYGCTLKAYRRDVIEGVRLYGEMHRFIPIYAAWQGARVTEMPVRHHPRRKGSSKYGFRRLYRVPLDLLVVKFLSSLSVPETLARSIPETLAHRWRPPGVVATPHDRAPSRSRRGGGGQPGEERVGRHEATRGEGPETCGRDGGAHRRDDGGLEALGVADREGGRRAA